MANEIIFKVTESLDGGYEAKAVGHSIYTQCDEYSELATTLRDAVRCHFEQDNMPSAIRIHLLEDEIIAEYDDGLPAIVRINRMKDEVLAE